MERLLYISQGKDPSEHIVNIRRMLDGGCKWVQLRIKNITAEELLPYADKAKIYCEEYQADFSINDYPEVARDVEAWGLHLGLQDIAVDEARTITGGNIKIGGTVNTIEDVRQRIKEGVDYLGLGPLRFTKTKQNLSPVLGFEGVNELMEFININDYKLPVIVVGGVIKPDVRDLLNSGVYGVGIATELTSADFPEDIISKIKEDINEAVKNS